MSCIQDHFLRIFDPLFADRFVAKVHIDPAAAVVVAADGVAVAAAALLDTSDLAHLETMMLLG